MTTPIGGTGYGKTSSDAILSERLYQEALAGSVSAKNLEYSNQKRLVLKLRSQGRDDEHIATHARLSVRKVRNHQK